MSELKYWNPDSGKNFGDALSETIVDFLKPNGSVLTANMLAVGSIMPNMLEDNIHVWGSGVHPKLVNLKHEAKKNVVFHAVRGPLTEQWLNRNGYEVKTTHGDPGLLTSLFIKPSYVKPTGKPIFVSHIFDGLDEATEWYGIEIVHAIKPLQYVVDKIVNASIVYSSSLHGLILADAYKKPSAIIQSLTEGDFKYGDYYYSTGRYLPEFYKTPTDNITPMMTQNTLESIQKALLKSFPTQIFKEQ